MVDVFVDTSAWYALRVGNDANNPKARQILERLSEERVWLHTSDWVLVETVSLVATRVGRQEAVRTGNWILRNAAVRVHPMADACEEAWTLFETLQGQASLVDCGSFRLMERLGVARAFAFDADFTKQGFKTE